MNLCHLYHKVFSYEHIQAIYDSFENSVAFDIENITSLEGYNLFIIELYNADQEMSKKLVSLFKHKKHSLVYFIIPKNYTLLLFQLTYLLGAKSIITQNQNIEKVISKIKADKEDFINDSFTILLGRMSLKTQNFVFYNNDKLTHVSQTLLHDFKCETKALFEANVLSNIAVNKLLENDVTLKTDIVNDLNVKKAYVCKSVTVTNNEKIIYMEVDTVVEKKLDFIVSRIAFVETLKETLLQRTISPKSLSILTISVENIKKILPDLGILELESLLFELVSFMDSVLSEKLVFSQFDQDFYIVLLENVDSERLITLANSFSAKVTNYVNTKNKKLILKIFAFSLDDLEFSSILKSLEDIENKNLITYKHIKEITNSESKVDERSLLIAAYDDGLKFKLLNIYNGLIINTASKILKVTSDSMYISFTQLQGVVLNIEKKTVLHSSSFTKDIEADVKQINLQKQIAVLENFRFLQTNANSRQYARVSPSNNIPIAINLGSTTVHGNILDLSIKSIAVKVKYIEKLGMLELKKASLVFNILDKSSENGYVQLNISANIVVVTNRDKEDYYKVVCDLNQDSHDIDTLLKYVYERQKELIIELKKMSKLN